MTQKEMTEVAEELLFAYASKNFTYEEVRRCAANVAAAQKFFEDAEAAAGDAYRCAAKAVQKSDAAAKRFDAAAKRFAEAILELPALTDAQGLAAAASREFAGANKPPEASL
jgi:post-segregation antitoxin (ccd killing protein)